MSQAENTQAFLAHHGVKGMKWGIRKERPTSIVSPKSDGVQVFKDGSISIEKGASIQRLVRSNGKSLPLKDITYASANDYDNAKYIKTIGGTGFFGGGRDQILTMQATKAIKAPSYDESTRMVSELYLNNAQFRNKATNILDNKISARELEAMRKDPVGKVAKAWYDSVNQAMTFDSEFDSSAPFVQKAVREQVQSKGYNALRDENDVRAGISKAPLIIFSPESSLKTVTVTNITDELRAANKQKLKEYKQQGRDWLDSQLYEER